MKWILLFMTLDTWGGGGLSAEFNSNAACEKAAKNFVAIHSAYMPTKTGAWGKIIRPGEVKQGSRQLGEWSHFWVCAPKG
jgi:hypothetical protein